MDSALFVHRLHFAFTATFHYLFPQLTMGLALLIVVLKTIGLRRNDPVYHEAARFWGRIFGINFVLGVVTGIPMEFQFGTNWSHFSRFAGGVIGQTLAMEGMFAFFLESAFLGLFLYGEKRLSPRAHWLSAVAVFVGSWLSGYFIIATDAFMQHPVGYFTGPDGNLQLASFWDFVLNPLGRMAIRAQHERSGDHGRVHHDVGGRVLSALRQVDGARPHLRQGWRDRRLRVQRAADFSDGRRTRQNGNRPATRDSGGDGGIVSGPVRSAAGDRRSA
jgi:hypothetical protein